ncbi:MAG: SCO family protein [Pyrinomonadaceae bacterium]
MKRYMNNPIRFLIAIAFTVSLCAVFATAQKNEHYNSPLYSPKYYDPSQGTANGIPEPLKKVGIEQRLGEGLPLTSEFKDENGQIVKLGDYFGKGRPVIIALVYYECPMLCNQVLNGLTGSLKGLSFDAGKEFDVIAVSFDAKEFDKPDLARNKKASYLERYGRPATEKGWHFLTGDQPSIDAITQATGFKYTWDEKSNQFAHGSAIMIATPEGKLSRYFYGIDYSPRDVKLGIMESAESKVGNAADELLLYCFHYDPASGKYGFQILSVLRLTAIAMLLGMGMMGFVFWRRNKSRNSSQEHSA